MSDSELGDYLRSLREAVTPAEVGLPAGFRRRTPGLRRSELATLAGVSVEYLTRLEQGRDRRPSAQVLAALAEALRLARPQRMHLRNLVKAASRDQLICRHAEPPARNVRPTVQALLDHLEPAPALLINRIGDVLRHTDAYRRLVGPLGLLDEEQPNLARYTFCDPRARDSYPEWARIADEQAADLRLNSALCDPHVDELIGELSVLAGAAFTDRFAGASSTPRGVPLQRLAHPEVGDLSLACETLDLPDTDQRLLVYLPADAGTSAALDRLAGRQPGGLRMVIDEQRDEQRARRVRARPAVIGSTTSQ
jgi:transcriptional regulator with XRE-family HTH domain